MRISTVQRQQFYFAFLKYGVIPESKVKEKCLRPVKVEAKVFWIVGVGANGEKLSAKLAVATQNACAGIRLAESVFETAGVDLEAFSVFN